MFFFKFKSSPSRCFFRVACQREPPYQSHSHNMRILLWGIGHLLATAGEAISEAFIAVGTLFTRTCAISVGGAVEWGRCDHICGVEDFDFEISKRPAPVNEQNGAEKGEFLVEPNHAEHPTCETLFLRIFSGYSDQTFFFAQGVCVWFQRGGKAKRLSIPKRRQSFGFQPTKSCYFIASKKNVSFEVFHNVLRFVFPGALEKHSHWLFRTKQSPCGISWTMESWSNLIWSISQCGGCGSYGENIS